MNHCCIIDTILLTTQYKTRPEGKLKNKKVNTNGMNLITLSCKGSAGFGDKYCCKNIVIPISTGKMK